MTQWEKGQSGNPGGRPREIAEVRDLAREHTPEAINTLAEIMNNKDSKDAARVSAASALLDRGYGRPAQALALEVKTKRQELSNEELARRILFIMASANHDREQQGLPLLDFRAMMAGAKMKIIDSQGVNAEEGIPLEQQPPED
jgi:hypothetical protein